MAGALSQLPPALVSMMTQGVSVLVASRDERLRPSVMRAMGSAVDTASGTVTVYVARSQAGELLRDIERLGHVAAMFSQPSTHASVQLKASRATLRPATQDDALALERYAAAMEREIEIVGYPRPVTRAMLAHRIDDLVAVSFEPEEVFEQTPGPKAGTRVAGGAA